MVSCPQEIYPKVKPVLEVIGKLFFVGTRPGQGQTMKLLNNLLSGTAMAISSEAVVMGVKAGLDPQQIMDVINAGSGRNSATQDKIPRCVIPRTFDFGFAISLLNKDIRLCLEEAEALGVPMIVGTAVRQLLAVTIATEGVECGSDRDRQDRGTVGGRTGRSEEVAVPSLSRRMARAPRRLKPGDLPKAVIDKVKIGLLDMLSCAFEAQELPWGCQAIQMASRAAAVTRASPVLSGRAFASPRAMRRSSTQPSATGSVREDMHTGSVSHLGVVIYPTLLALAQRTPVSGQRFHSALLLAVTRSAAAIGKASGRRRVRPAPSADRHNGTNRARAMAGSLLLGLGEDATVSAIGLAANTAGGLTSGRMPAVTRCSSIPDLRRGTPSLRSNWRNSERSHPRARSTAEPGCSPLCTAPIGLARSRRFRRAPGRSCRSITNPRRLVTTPRPPARLPGWPCRTHPKHRHRRRFA